MTTAFAPLVAELDRWAAAGRKARFWLRDDDATQPTPSLDRLLTSAERVPLTLAVIPEPTGIELAQRLDQEQGVAIAVHGWRHQDYSDGVGKKAELGPQRPPEVVLAELKQGAERLALLHPDRFQPVLVPPWNRIDPALIPHLTGAGFRALSVFGPAHHGAVRAINSDVDLIDWKGARGGRDAALLVGEIIARLHVMFAQGGAMGLLTHHLVHDERAWNFVGDLLSATDHPGCTWVGLSELLNTQT